MYCAYSQYCSVIEAWAPLPVNKARILSCVLADDKIDIEILFKKGFESKSLYINIIYEKGMDRERESKDITIKNTHIEIKTKFKPERVMAYFIDGDLQLDASQIDLRRQEIMEVVKTSDNSSPNNNYSVKKLPTVFISHSIQDIELLRE